MAKVYLEDYNQHYRREIVARLPSPQRYIPIIRYAIGRYMMEDANSIDSVYIKVDYVSNVFYCGSKYALRYKIYSAEDAYIRVQYPDIGVYFKDYRNHGVDDRFVLLVTDAVCLEYNLICRISVKIIKNSDSDAYLYMCGYSYLCEL